MDHVGTAEGGRPYVVRVETSVQHPVVHEHRAPPEIGATSLTPLIEQGYPLRNGSCLHFGASTLGWFHLQR
jgi:hypothetical protein